MPPPTILPELSRDTKAYRKGETLPTYFDTNEILSTALAAGIGLRNGMPQIGANNLGDKILLEGRGDAGTNHFNTNNKRAVALNTKIAEELSSRNITPTRSGSLYPAAVLDKSEVATRLNIPFELAWNGTGKTADNSANGQRHAARATQMEGAINDPRNVNLADMIKRGIEDKLTPQETLSLIISGNYRKFDKVFKGTAKAMEVPFTLGQVGEGSADVSIETANKFYNARTKLWDVDYKNYYLAQMGLKGPLGEKAEDIATDPYKKMLLDIGTGIDPGGEKAKQFLNAIKPIESNPLKETLLDAIGLGSK